MIGVIGDLHFRPRLPYSEYVKGGREAEEQLVLDHIVTAFADCETIVFMGDLLHARNNTAEVIRKMMEFIERFNEKHVCILCGNHERSGDGRTALDFLSEIKGRNWTIVLNEVVSFNNLTFLPFINNAQLHAKDHLECRRALLELLPEEKNHILFTHYALSGCVTNSGESTDSFSETVLPREELERYFSLVVAGHIHKPQAKERTLVTGSVFNAEVGETQKYVWRVDEETFQIDAVKLPGRGIRKLENPSLSELNELKRTDIIKVVLTDPKLKDQVESIKAALQEQDAYLLSEQFPHTRKKVHFEEGILEMNPEELLRLYCKQKKLSFKSISPAFELIK